MCVVGDGGDLFNRSNFNLKAFLIEQHTILLNLILLANSALFFHVFFGIFQNKPFSSWPVLEDLELGKSFIAHRY